MPAGVPSLETSTYLTDTQSIIAYTWRKYARTPNDVLSDIQVFQGLIISLPYQMARFGKEPGSLCSNMQTDLQGVLNRIFKNDPRTVSVSVTEAVTSDTTCDINVSFMYTTLSGETQGTGTTITLDTSTGRLVIPEDNLSTILLAD